MTRKEGRMTEFLITRITRAEKELLIAKAKELKRTVSQLMRDMVRFALNGK